MVEIRLCKIDEKESLKKFIDTDWKKDHILATHTTLLKWQHYNKPSNNFNFIIAYDKQKNEIVGILGFIPVYHFDNKLINNNDFWLAIWKIKSDYKGIGIELFNYFVKKFKPNSIGCIGINNTVRRLYKVLKFKTGILNQYYLLNPALEIYNIAKISPLPINDKVINSEYIVIKLRDPSQFNNLDYLYYPQKSSDYIINRYTNHPIYNYNFYGIFQHNAIVCILVTRKILINNSSCIRIIDILGNLNLGSIKSELINLLIVENAEYIDCLNFGIPEQTFINLGFSKHNFSDQTIIPTYFEPFELKNVPIQFAYSSDLKNYVIFKGDSDQDRPNAI
ncbi:MAG: hypothetical protein JW717_05435 [Marinilabiliaceae bacterium]|nr:hypothetical protein [Marinilabiliaceae bacterium]